jgi:molybdenum cofactor cytidylyltransferase
MIQGILLAAGFGRRFQAESASTSDKLLVRLDDQKTILWHSAQALIASLPNSIAVVRPQQQTRKKILQQLGFVVLESTRAENGLGYALADAVTASPLVTGWLIALADMPWISAELIRQIANKVSHPQSIVAPRFNNQRGQPIAFGAGWHQHLCALQGDTGARDLLKTANINWLDWHDDSIHRDVDTPLDIVIE